MAHIFWHVIRFGVKTEKTERSISQHESASEAEAEADDGSEEIMGDNTGDEVDLSFDESSENDDDETGEGSGLYHSWSFLGPSRSGSGRIVTRSPSSEMLNSRPRSSTRGTLNSFSHCHSPSLFSGNAILRMVSLFFV
jgi:hypothetical protein